MRSLTLHCVTDPLLGPLHAVFMTIPFPMPLCLETIQPCETMINWKQRAMYGTVRMKKEEQEGNT